MDTLGVCSNIDSQELNLYFLEVLNGILEAGIEYSQNITIFSLKDWQREEAKLLAFCDGRVDGMICIGPQFSPTFAETLQQHTPFITLHSSEVLPRTHSLTVDDGGGAYAMTQQPKPGSSPSRSASRRAGTGGTKIEAAVARWAARGEGNAAGLVPAALCLNSLRLPACISGRAVL